MKKIFLYRGKIGKFWKKSFLKKIFYKKVSQLINILYFCRMKRTIYKSNAFEEYYFSLNNRTKKKMDFVLQIIQDEEIVSTKFNKKILNSDFYELRISTESEFRVLNFTLDNDNFINSSKVLLLNGFIKKSESDYPKQIIIAKNIMYKEGFINGNN